MNKQLNLAKMKTKLAALTIAALLAACGGGSGGGGTSATTFTVIDGLLQGATVCADANNNGICEKSEIYGTTNASGVVSFNVPAADVGKYPTLVEVPVGAVDADDPTNPIATAYTLKAPASNPTVITPLTTLVQHLIEAGQTSTQAAESVANQTGVTNVFANFIATPDANARTVAKTIVKLVQEKTKELADIKGKMDPVTGVVVSQADVDKAIRVAIANLPAATMQSVSALGQAGGACVDPTAAACKVAISTAVGTPITGLQASTGLTVANAATQSGIGKLLVTPETVVAGTPTAGGTFRWLTFNDVNNWYSRASIATAVESTPNNAGETLYRDVRWSTVGGGTTLSGGLINEGRTDDIHWNGTAWVAACNKDFQNVSTRVGTSNTGTYNFCDGISKGNSTRVKVDMSGKTIADMVTAIRATPGRGDGGYWAGWGSSNGQATTPLAAGFSSPAVLPTGSYLYYSSSMPTAAAITYIISGHASSFRQTPAAAAAGGDATVGGTLPACAMAANQVFTTATSIDAVIAQNRGTPCKLGTYVFTGFGGASFTSDTPAGTPNEWWNQSTLNIGTYCPTGTTCLATVSTTADVKSYYTGRLVLSVAFTGDTTNKQTTYYTCRERFDGGYRNCKAIGTGTYDLTTLGDAKVLSFAGVPNSPLSYSRLYVERDNVVRLAFRGNLNPSTDVRPNLTAMNALFKVLGIPVVTP